MTRLCLEHLVAECQKIAYPTPDAAMRAGAAFLAKCIAHKRPKLPRAVHPCSQCHAWHVTSQSTRPAWRIPGCAA